MKNLASLLGCIFLSLQLMSAPPTSYCHSAKTELITSVASFQTFPSCFCILSFFICECKLVIHRLIFVAFVSLVSLKCTLDTAHIPFVLL